MVDTAKGVSTLRAWWILQKAAVRSQSQYRINLLLSLLGGMAYQGITLIFMGLLILSFQTIEGWHYSDIGLMVSMRLCSHAIYVLLFGSIMHLPRLVFVGAIDKFLTTPVNLFAQVITYRFNILGIGDVLLGVASLAVFVPSAIQEWELWKIIYLLFAILGGGFIETATQVTIAAFSFRHLSTNSLQILVDTTVGSFGVFPLTVFGARGLLILCSIFPLGLISFLPASAILGFDGEVVVPPWIVWVSPIFGWCLLPVALIFFNLMSRLYSSPSGE